MSSDPNPIVPTLTLAASLEIDHRYTMVNHEGRSFVPRDLEAEYATDADGHWRLTYVRVYGPAVLVDGRIGSTNRQRYWQPDCPMPSQRLEDAPAWVRDYALAHVPTMITMSTGGA